MARLEAEVGELAHPHAALFGLGELLQHLELPLREAVGPVLAGLAGCGRRRQPGPREQRVDLARGPRRDPRGVVEGAVAEERQAVAHAVARGAPGRLGDDEQVPRAVPGMVVRAVDAGGGVLEPTLGACGR